MDRKAYKKMVRIAGAVFVIGLVMRILVGGIERIPGEYRDIEVSIFTPDLKWGTRPSEVILRYGLPEKIEGMSDVTGDIHLSFDVICKEKNTEMTIANKYFPDAEIYRYNYKIDCKTNEEAQKIFESCHNDMMTAFKNEDEFSFLGSETEKEFDYTGKGNYVLKCGENEAWLVDEDWNEIPVSELPEEQAKDVKVEVRKVNNYIIKTGGSWGAFYTLTMCEGEPFVYFRAEFYK